MNRRHMMQSTVLGTAAVGLSSLWPSSVKPSPWKAPQQPIGLPSIKITDVKSILTAPAGI